MKNLICLLAITSLLACSKDEGSDYIKPDVSEYAFDFNGKTYKGSHYIITMDSEKKLQELFLFESGLFGGTIRYYPSIGCGFMVPDSMQWEWTTYMNANCRIKVDGQYLIDSTKIYFYRSGSVQYYVTDCEYHSGYTIDGTPVKWDECTITGSFALTLGNKNDDLIEIKNGSFRYEKFMIDR